MNKKALGGALAAMLAISVPFIAGWEGKRNDPYEDKIAGGLMTVCYGETRVPMRRYSDAECLDMLRNGTEGFAWKVAARNPGLVYYPNMWAAHTSLTYNIGIAAYNRSSVARRFEAGDWRGACNAMLAWNRAGGRVVRGLQRRREAERRLCLKGL